MIFTNGKDAKHWCICYGERCQHSEVRHLPVNDVISLLVNVVIVDIHRLLTSITTKSENDVF